MFELRAVAVIVASLWLQRLDDETAAFMIPLAAVLSVHLLELIRTGEDDFHR